MPGRPKARRKAQISMDEKWLEDPDLLDVLERREESRGHLEEYRKIYSQVDQEAKGAMAELPQLGEGPVRIGRFVLSRKEVGAKSVSFNSKAKVEFGIKLAKAANGATAKEPEE